MELLNLGLPVYSMNWIPQMKMMASRSQLSIIFICLVFFLTNLHCSDCLPQQLKQVTTSTGQVQPINYNNARYFLDRCRNVSRIHFDHELKTEESLPSPIIPPSTAPPSFPIYSSETRQTEKCEDIACFARHLERDLRQINEFSCRNDDDCKSSEELRGGKIKSEMVCRKFSTGYSTLKYCDCPRYSAYNPLLCTCEPAEQCGNHSQVYCQNGMKCADKKCSCRNFRTLLLEPHGQFCVEKKTTDAVNEYNFAKSGSTDNGFLAAIIVLAAIISIGLLTFCVYASSQTFRDGFCDRGQYVCDENSKEKAAKARRTGAGQPRNEEKIVHVAAWDLPGLDVLSEEETMKYLHREQRQEATNDVPDQNGGFLDEDNLSAVTSTPNSKSCQNNKLKNIPLKRFGGQQNINKPINGAAVVNGIGDGSTTCPSSTSSPSSGRSGGGSLPESDRFENPSGENIALSNQDIQDDPSGLTKLDRDNPNSEKPFSKTSLHSLTMQSNIL